MTFKGLSLTLAHRFVREFYISEPESQNFRLTDLCLTYLSFDCLKIDLTEVELRQSILNGDYSFLEYAAKNWLDHLRNFGSDRDHLSPEQYSDIRRKTKVVLDCHQLSRVHDYTPDPDIPRYFLAFSDCPEIFLHPTLRGESQLNQRFGEGWSLRPSIIQPKLLATDRH